MMVDRFGRVLTYLRVSVIDRCNLRCLYCRPQNYTSEFLPSEILTNDELFEMIAHFCALGIRKVRLTGGEPLLRKDLPSLVQRIKKLPGMREVVMTTNAVLLSRYADALREAGLDRINISLDTLDRSNFTRITGIDRLGQVLTGIDAAYRCGLRPVKINTVLMKGYNDHEILDLVSFAVEHGFDIRFIEWMPTSGDLLNCRNSRWIKSDAAKEVILKRYELVPDDTDPHSPARTYRMEGIKQSRVGFISPLSNQFCAQCNRLRLKANGMLKTCLHGKEDLDLRALLREGTRTDLIRRRIIETVYDRPKEHDLNRETVAHQDFVMTAVGG